MRRVLTALITPFDDRGQLDLDALSFLLEMQREAGVDGVVLLGTTGESATLTQDEKSQILQRAVSEKGQLQIVVGTGSSSTDATLDASKWARDLGADQLLVVSPYYNRPTQRGLYAHFAALEEVGLPVIVYNHPGRTGVEIEPLTLRELSLLPHIVATKECSGSILHASEVLQHTRDDFLLYAGDDAMTLPTMAIGGHGVISTLANLLPRLLVDLVDAGEGEEARRLHRQLIPLARGMNLETNPIPVKEAMRQLGLPAGPCRMPLTPMSQPSRDALHTLLAEVGR